MQNALLMPFVLPRQFTNDGQPLSGGKLFFYQSGTMTPKATYAVADKSVLNTNPVILDAGGFAPVFLDTGAYRIIVQDSDGVQIEQPMDGLYGSGGGAGFDNVTLTMVGTYNELRGLQLQYDLVYVAGRSFAGDGGQGWFYHDSNSQLSDDDGYILTSNSGATKYIRLNQNTIDPLFYGVSYNSVSNQYTPFLKAVGGSVQFGLTLLVDGNVYLNQNIVIPTKASIEVTETGAFTSTVSITMTFTAGSNFTAAGRTFAQTVNPIFQKGVVNQVLFSWMGSTVIEDRWSKFIGSTSATQLVLDESVTLAVGTFNIPNSFIFAEKSIIGVTSGTNAVSISIPNLVSNSNEQIFDIKSTTSVLSLNLGSYTRPEWFGAKGNGIADDYLPFIQCIPSEKIYLQRSKSYLVNGTVPNISGSLIIEGGGTLYLNTIITAYYLKIINIIVFFTGSGNWLNATTFIAYQSTFSNQFTCPNPLIDGCAYLEYSNAPVYDGKPSIFNAYLPLIKDAPSLYTDASGKIAKRSWQEGKSWTVTNFSGSTNIYYSLRYLNGTWIILGSGGLIKTSTDFVNWTTRVSGVTTTLSDVCWNGTYYVAVGDFTTMLRSTDLITWTPAVTRPNTTGTLQWIVTNGTRFVTTDGLNGQVITSSDGLNWIASYSFGGSSGYMASYGNGIFLCGGNNGAIATSVDGSTFTSRTIQSGPQFFTSFYDTVNNYWIAASAGTIAIATDPTNNSWTYYVTGQTETIYNMIRVGQTIVAVGANGRIMTSPNGKYWTTRYSGTVTFMYGIAANGYDVYSVGQHELIIQADK